ncbi:signal peptidase II [Candidatus Avelusimicrobium alvi]|uniref:signal peptidase II n=1 Tax=Candidatus Avelusimicrobium alvi TaxID=3416221 RepID=UPI003D144FC8
MRNAWNKSREWLLRNYTVVSALCAIFLFDHLTKVVALLYLPDDPVKIFPFFYLTYVENTGAAFGMMKNGNFLLIFVMLAIIAYIIISWKELCSYGRLVKWGAVFILAGALGNLYDRITLGFVVDFLDFRVWPVFNVADSFITIGGCMFALSLLLQLGKKREEK